MHIKIEKAELLSLYHAAYAAQRKVTAMDVLLTVNAALVQDTDVEVQLKQILTATQQAFELTAEQLVAKVRTRPIIDAKHTFYFIAKKLLGRRASLNRIGRVIGTTDHTTVINGIRKIEGLIEVGADPDLELKIFALLGKMQTF